MTRSPFAVIGIEGHGATDHAPEWIRPLWEQAARRRPEVESQLCGPAWGLMSDLDDWLQPWTDRGRYLAGWEVDPCLPAPEGWTVWQIPSTTFAALECTLASYGTVLARLREALACHPTCRQAGAVHEFYPRPFHNPATDTLWLYTATQLRT